MPQSAAGMRVEPPVSVPSPPGTMPEAIAAAVPPRNHQECASGRKDSSPDPRIGEVRAGDAEGELMQVRLGEEIARRR